LRANIINLHRVFIAKRRERFLLFNPSKSVQSRLSRARSIAEFYIPSFEEMMALLSYANNRYALAA
jgi:hypothetical protein